jgi:hypothetical protein
VDLRTFQITEEGGKVGGRAVVRRKQIPSIHINRNNTQDKKKKHTDSYMFPMKMFTNIFCSTTINTKTEDIICRFSSCTFNIRLLLLSHAFVPEFGWTNPCA